MSAIPLQQEHQLALHEIDSWVEHVRQQPNDNWVEVPPGLLMRLCRYAELGVHMQAVIAHTAKLDAGEFIDPGVEGGAGG